MGGIVKTVSNAISTVTNSTPFKVVFPVQAVAQAATKAVTGMSSGDQYLAGAAGGAAIAGGAALLPGVAGAAGAGGAGAGGSGGLSILSASGGIPMLTKVLLGASVASTVAAFFGKKPGDDYQNFVNGLNADEQAQVQQLTDNLTQLQGNLDARNAAVSQIVDNYPHIVDQALSDINSSGLSSTMDEMDRLSLDKASDQLAAKYAASGGFSSGAFNQGLAKAATDITISRDQSKLDLANQTAQQKLTEANALRSFAQRMLGVGVDQRFTATQDALTAKANAGATLAGINASDANARRSSLASIAGSTAQAGINLAAFNALKSSIPGASPALTPTAGSPSLPGGGAPLPDLALAGAGA